MTIFTVAQPVKPIILKPAIGSGVVVIGHTVPSAELPEMLKLKYRNPDPLGGLIITGSPLSTNAYFPQSLAIVLMSTSPPTPSFQRMVKFPFRILWLARVWVADRRTSNESGTAVG